MVVVLEHFMPVVKDVKPKHSLFENHKHPFVTENTKSELQTAAPHCTILFKSVLASSQNRTYNSITVFCIFFTVLIHSDHRLE